MSDILKIQNLDGHDVELEVSGKSAVPKSAEPVIPSVNLGGRVWFLKVTHRVLERFSSISKCSLQEFDAALLRYDSMVLLLWLMMVESRPDLTRGKLDEWLNALSVFDAMQKVSKAVADAVEYSFPKPAEIAGSTDEVDAENPTAGDI